MKTLILDIETIGEPFEAIDPETQEHLTKRIRRDASNEEEYQELLEQTKKELGLSPLTGEVIVIGLTDYATHQSTVYFQAPESDIPDRFSEGEVTYIKTTERGMLRSFWDIARNYNTFVTFSGWQFDIPFLNIRSALNRIKPSQNLMVNRFLNNQRTGVFHIDLQDQLSYYAAVKKKGSLHMWSRAIGIESPKTEGVLAEDVSKLFYAGKYLDIARYNARDIKATEQLFDFWDTYLNLGR
ncbi:MAG: ribonuclease H-like domain-containing protein [Patescibacteria group bacterium]